MERDPRADGRITGTDSVDSGVIVNLTPSR